MSYVNRYKVVLLPSEEGVAVSCPALPGCWSQGVDEADALANIAVAIQEYLDATGAGARS
ncbi:MAG TPA: type II toxin-antitoxin system HicB family antitoxin [Tepidiformaceae bacterium]|nr:type II toxin-antitoxin system HicB family antitoxin [Tepidiformaceae bacterium]